MRDFFGQRRIQKALDIIAEEEITGWEKWWQIEFAIFLSEDEDISEWDIETPFFADLRKKKKQDTASIDISFRKKGTAKGKFIFLELKQNLDYVKCFRGMLKDAEKVYASHSKSIDGVKIREFFVVGVYRRVDKKEVINCLLEIQKDYDVEFEKEDIKTIFIPNTEYSFTIFN